MIWADTIQDLQYYHTGTEDYCYCELLLFPTDLTLQGRLPAVDDTAIFIVEAYTPNGITVLLSDIDDRVKGIIGTDSEGNYYFTLQLKSFPTQLCGQCFVVRVTIRNVIGGEFITVFDKFTQQYCIANCCNNQGEIEANGQVYTSTTVLTNITDECGKPIQRISGTFRCMDNFTGEYYGPAQTKITGKNNGDLDDVLFTKVSNIRGTFKRTLSQIERIISRNCRTQKVQRAIPWELIGMEQFPTWKMTDLENTLCSENIYINNQPYIVPSGEKSFFTKIINNKSDYLRDFFTLKLPVEECRQWQVYGCADICPAYNQERTYGFTTEIDAIYDSDGKKIGTSIHDFVIYLQSLNGATEAEDVSAAMEPLGYTRAATIKSTGFIPSFFYVNYFGASSKVFAQEELPDLTEGCSIPLFGTIYDEDGGCADPIIGTVFDEDYPQDTDQVYSQANWLVQGGSTAVLMSNTVELNFTSRNATYGNSSQPPVIVSGDVIGIVNAPFIPVSERVITNNLPANTYIIVTTSGEVKYFGEATDVQTGYAEIIITNLIYNL